MRSSALKVDPTASRVKSAQLNSNEFKGVRNPTGPPLPILYVPCPRVIRDPRLNNWRGCPARWRVASVQQRLYTLVLLVTTDYTDIVARFTDQLAAETLAKYIASAGFPCDVVDIGPISRQPYGVRVSRNQIADIRRVLKLTPVVNGLTPVAAQMTAGQLAREEIPCYIGGEHSFGASTLLPGTSHLTLDSITTLKETKEPGDMIAVPASLFQEAMRVVNQAPISEAELTELALGIAPDPKDPT
jgi:hypothetical protein